MYVTKWCAQRTIFRNTMFVTMWTCIASKSHLFLYDRPNHFFIVSQEKNDRNAENVPKFQCAIIFRDKHLLPCERIFLKFAIFWYLGGVMSIIKYYVVWVKTHQKQVYRFTSLIISGPNEISPKASISVYVLAAGCQDGICVNEIQNTRPESSLEKL